MEIVKHPRTVVEALCSRCKKINFDALRGPSATDLEDLIVSKDPGVLFARLKPGATSNKVELGPLNRIQKEASMCPLCSLFYQIIKRQGAVYQHSSAYKTLDNNDIHFRADPDVSYYAKITGLNTASNKYFAFRRLNLTAHTADSPDHTIAYFDHVVQVCDVGTLLAPAEVPAMQTHRKVGGMPFGGRKRPLKVDLQLIHGWIKICTNEHGPQCSLNPTQVDSTHMNVFRLIDVQNRLIREIHNSKLAELKFVALSYVWGSTQTIKLSKANIIRLKKPGALSELQLPRTITDSMDLINLLGLQYLWIDALCIIQDDQNDQICQIGKMDTIYASAFFTILAASGKDSNAGLPGLRSSTRFYEQQEVVVLQASENDDGLSVMNTLKSYPCHWDEWYTRGQEDADSSTWSHRAWTMQEMALSHRTLMFTDEQLFWRCRQAYFCEESYFEEPRTTLKHFYPSVHKVSTQKLTEVNSDPWELYEELVNNYMHRALTYQGDIHGAFQAILAAMERTTKTGFLWGLPLSHFELALLWETFHGVYRRTALSTIPMTSLNKQVAFPSWSWMGWVGNIHCRVGHTRRESESPLVVCFIHRNDPLRLCHVTPKIGGSTESDLWTDCDIQRKRVSLYHVKQHLPNLNEEVLARLPEEHLLFFWTHSAFFSVAYTNISGPAASLSEYGEKPRPSVQDKDGNDVGFVCKIGSQHSHSSTSRGENSPQEFVAVGRRQISDITESIAEEICPPSILALQIERDERGISSRVNFAEINQRAWMHAEPKVTLVALQ